MEPDIVCVGWIESYVKSWKTVPCYSILMQVLAELLARHGRSDELDLIFQSYTNAVRRLSS